MFVLFSELSSCFWIAVCFVVSGSVFYFELKKRTVYRGITNFVPTEYGLPIVGYLYKWMPLSKFFTSFEKSFTNLKCSTFFTFFATNPIIITIDPDIVKCVLTSEKFLNKARSFYGAIDRAIHNGLITTNGEQWKRNRKLLNSSFNHNVLASLMPTFNKGAEKTILKFGTLVDKNEVKVFEIIKQTVFHIAFETNMGTRLQDNLVTDIKVVKDFNFLIRKVSDDLLFSTLNLGFIVRTPKYYTVIGQFRKTILKIIHELSNSEQRGNSKPTVKSDSAIKKSSEVFINRALDFKMTGLFTEQNVVSETLTMLAGTFDTVSTTIYSLLVLLAMHPDVQDKLYQEVCSILANVDSVVEIDHLRDANIPYTNMVLDETLRLMPSIPIIGREISTDTWLTKELLLPKNVQIAIPVFNLHRSKELWGPNANAFNPENFLPSEVSQRHPYAYIPYSKGLRNCLGWRYGHIILRVLTLRLVRNFKFSTNFQYEDLVFLQKLSLRYEKEPSLKIENRI